MRVVPLWLVAFQVGNGSSFAVNAYDNEKQALDDISSRRRYNLSLMPEGKPVCVEIKILETP